MRKQQSFETTAAKVSPAVGEEGPRRKLRTLTHFGFELMSSQVTEFISGISTAVTVSRQKGTVNPRVTIDVRRKDGRISISPIVAASTRKPVKPPAKTSKPTVTVSAKPVAKVSGLSTLSVAQRIAGLQKALANPNTPKQLRPSMQARLEKLQAQPLR